jgi:hypothetical protein
MELIGNIMFYKFSLFARSTLEISKAKSLKSKVKHLEKVKFYIFARILFLKVYSV